MALKSSSATVEYVVAITASLITITLYKLFINTAFSKE